MPWSDWWTLRRPLASLYTARPVEDLAAALAERYIAVSGHPVPPAPPPWAVSVSPDTDGKAPGARYLSDDGMMMTVAYSGGGVVVAGDTVGTEPYLPTGRTSQAWRLNGPPRNLAMAGGCELHLQPDGSLQGGYIVDYGVIRTVRVLGKRVVIDGIPYRCLDASPVGGHQWRGTGGEVVLLQLWRDESAASPVWRRASDGAELILANVRGTNSRYLHPLLWPGSALSFSSQWTMTGGIRGDTVAPARIGFASTAYSIKTSGWGSGREPLAGIAVYASNLGNQSTGNGVEWLDITPISRKGTEWETILSTLSSQWRESLLWLHDRIAEMRVVRIPSDYSGIPWTWQYGRSEAYEFIRATITHPARFRLYYDGALVEGPTDYTTSWQSENQYPREPFLPDHATVTAELQLEYV